MALQLPWNMSNLFTSDSISNIISTIESADSIMVMDHGEIIEQGSHRQLLKQGGAYAELHEAQSKKKNRRGLFRFIR